MEIEAFERTLQDATPPSDLGPALTALWHVARGEWDHAHGIVQLDEESARNNWVHAYLHRVEGDLANAAYWYRRAGQPVAGGELPAEWRAIVSRLLASR